MTAVMVVLRMCCFVTLIASRVSWRALDLWPINSAAFYVLAALFSTGPLPFRYLATVNKLARLSIGS